MLQQVRGRMGEILWREAPVEADLVISVPDSGNPAADGFARASGIPHDDGLIKNRYVARTFIQPGQELRKHGLRMKFNPLPEIVAGKRMVVVDDSIVRGNTTRQIVGMLRDAGASEVHLRISSPPIRHPCHYGVDMSTREEMIAHERTVEEIADELGADSLAYLSMEGVYEAVGTPARGPLRRLLHRPLPARRPRGGERQIRPRGHRRGPRPPYSVRVTRRGQRFDCVLPPGRGPTCRRSSTGCTAGMGSRWWGWPPTSPPPRRWRGPGRRAWRRRLLVRRTTRTASPRDAAIAGWLESERRRADRPRRVHGAALARVRRRFRNRIVNVHPALLPSFPGLDAVGQALGGGRTGDRGDGPPGRRGRGLGADDLAARHRRCLPLATAPGWKRRSTRSSTSSTRRRSARSPGAGLGSTRATRRSS